MKKRGLGRGLDALLKSQTAPAVAAAVDGATRAVAVADLRPGKFQPRGGFDDDALRELAASIRARGVLQPIIARALPAGELEIVAGERRWRAAKIAGLESVPCLVRAIDDDEALSCALIENLQREDLNPLEIAEGLRRLVSRFGLTQEQAAAGLGMSRPAAANLLRLLALAAPVKKMLAAGEIEMGHARALLPLPPTAQEAAARKIAAQKLTVRATENLVRQMTRPDSANGAPARARSRHAPPRRIAVGQTGRARDRRARQRRRRQTYHPLPLARCARFDRAPPRPTGRRVMR